MRGSNVCVSRKPMARRVNTRTHTYSRSGMLWCVNLGLALDLASPRVPPQPRSPSLVIDHHLIRIPEHEATAGRKFPARSLSCGSRTPLRTTGFQARTHEEIKRLRSRARKKRRPWASADRLCSRKELNPLRAARCFTSASWP